MSVLGDLVHPEHVVIACGDTTATDVIRSLSSLLETSGHVEAGYADACVRREGTDPTGLPTPGAAVAIPHAEPTLVTRPAVAVAVPRRPIPFAQMGDPDIEVLAEVVFLLALTEPQGQLVALSQIASLVQDPERLRTLVGAASPEELRALIVEHDQEQPQ